MNYAVQYNALQRRYESLLADMRQVLGLLRRGRFRAALAQLDSILGDEPESDSEDAMEQEADQPIEIAPSDAAAGFAPFVGPAHRLD